MSTAPCGKKADWAASRRGGGEVEGEEEEREEEEEVVDKVTGFAVAFDEADGERAGGYNVDKGEDEEL